MTQNDKLRARLRERVFSGWTFPEVDRVLLLEGFQRVGSSGSHHTYKHTEHPHLFTVPWRTSEIKHQYLRELLKIITKLESQR